MSVTVSNINTKDFTPGLKCLSSAFSKVSQLVTTECGYQVLSAKTVEVKKIPSDVTPTMAVQNAFSVVPLGGAIFFTKSKE